VELRYGGQGVLIPAVGPTGVIYVGSSDQRLYAINPNGSLRWSYLTGDVVHSSPAVAADGTVYVTSNDLKLYALDPGGSLKWTYATQVSSRLTSPVLGGDGAIYVGSTDHSLYAINPDGSEKWAYATTDRIEVCPALRADVAILCRPTKTALFMPSILTAA